MEGGFALRVEGRVWGVVWDYEWVWGFRGRSVVLLARECCRGGLPGAHRLSLSGGGVYRPPDRSYLLVSPSELYHRFRLRDPDSSSTAKGQKAPARITINAPLQFVFPSLLRGLGLLADCPPDQLVGTRLGMHLFVVLQFE